MPIVHITGSPIKLECNVPFSEEFPDIMTGYSDDDEILYFDATALVEGSGNPQLSVDKFFFNFNYIHLNLSKSLELDTKKTVRVNRNDNHILIDATFALLFILYVEPHLIAYYYQKLLALLQDGIVLSDSLVATLAKRQLGDEMLKTLIENGGEQGVREPTETETSSDV